MYRLMGRWPIILLRNVSVPRAQGESGVLQCDGNEMNFGKSSTGGRRGAPAGEKRSLKRKLRSSDGVTLFAAPDVVYFDGISETGGYHGRIENRFGRKLRHGATINDVCNCSGVELLRSRGVK